MVIIGTLGSYMVSVARHVAVLCNQLTQLCTVGEKVLINMYIAAVLQGKTRPVELPGTRAPGGVTSY